MNHFRLADFRYVRVNATADGNNTVITGTSGKSILVVGYTLNVTAAGSISVRDGAATVYADFSLPAFGGAAYSGGVNAPAFKLATGSNLVINNVTAGVDTTGHLTYILVADDSNR